MYEIIYICCINKCRVGNCSCVFNKKYKNGQLKFINQIINEFMVYIMYNYLIVFFILNSLEYSKFMDWSGNKNYSVIVMCFYCIWQLMIVLVD